MKEFSYTIKDPLGIHARPAGVLVKHLQTVAGNVTITRGADSCDGKRLIALMKMRCKMGETITFQFDGSDEAEEAKAAEAAEAYVKELL
jgi:phosphocarrier protein